jgi:DNA-binding XRE family transcriptional regulator
MMTTTRNETISQILKAKRGDRFKTTVANEIGVSRQSYDMWESGHHIPEDEQWAEALAAYLDRDIRDVVWILYQSRVVKKGPGDTPIIHGLSDRSWAIRPTDNRPSNREAA